MTIRETLIFIHRPVSEIVRGYQHGDAPKEIHVDNEVAYLFNGDNPENAEFGLTSDLDAPEGKEWTQLLHREPENAAALAETLRLLDVDPAQLRPATDWDGNSLVDLAPVEKHLRKRPAAATRANYPNREASTKAVIKKNTMTKTHPNKKSEGSDNSGRAEQSGPKRESSKTARQSRGKTG